MSGTEQNKKRAADTLLVARDLLSTDAEAAAELFKLALSFDDTLGAAWQGLTIAAAKLGDRELARHAALRATALLDDVVSHCLLAEICWQQLDVTAAITAIKRCIELDQEARHPSGVRARALLFAIEEKLSG